MKRAHVTRILSGKARPNVRALLLIINSYTHDFACFSLLVFAMVKTSFRSLFLFEDRPDKR